jgi:hypothetical protein
MKIKFVKLILIVTRLSKKMEAMSKDLDKIADLLQDPEILSVLGEKNLGVLTLEDFD